MYGSLPDSIWQMGRQEDHSAENLAPSGLRCFHDAGNMPFDMHAAHVWSFFILHSTADFQGVTAGIQSDVEFAANG